MWKGTCAIATGSREPCARPGRKSCSTSRNNHSYGAAIGCPSRHSKLTSWGTANLRKALRAADRLCSIVVVTSDKRYESHEGASGYRGTGSCGDPEGPPRTATNFSHATPGAFRVRDARDLLYGKYHLRRAILSLGIITISVFLPGSIGLNSLGVGVLGEHLGRTYSEVKRRPLFIVEETVKIDLPTNEKEALLRNPMGNGFSS